MRLEPAAPLARALGLLMLALLLAACAGTRGSARIELADIPREPRSRYGNPPSYEVSGKRYYVMDSADGFVERGIASWYGPKFHGRKTSSGEIYDMHAMTAAHKSLPLPTYVRVTNLENGRSLILKVNDRGPFVRNRIIDLSYAAAHELDIVAKGTGLVEVRALTPGRPVPAPPVLVQRAPVDPMLERHPDIFIQVGAFSNRQSAEQMRGELILKGVEDVRVQEGEGLGRPVFRVRIGPLASVELADRAGEHLERMGVMDYRVVID